MSLTHNTPRGRAKSVSDSSETNANMFPDPFFSLSACSFCLISCEVSRLSPLLFLPLSLYFHLETKVWNFRIHVVYVHHENTGALSCSSAKLYLNISMLPWGSCVTTVSLQMTAHKSCLIPKINTFDCRTSVKKEITPNPLLTVRVKTCFIRLL